MSSNYDLITVLGYALDENWNIPSHVYPRIAKSAELYHSKVAHKIAVVGKWQIHHHRKKNVPPITEAEKMKQILISEHQVPENAILKEEYSMDTIGNAFYLKKDITEVHNYKRLLILCADYHLKRVKFIFHKVFGSSYKLDYLATRTDLMDNSSFVQGQDEIYKQQKEFLSFMKPGDHDTLQDKLYSHPYYDLK